ncbi:MAG TPA: phage major capsid protein [Actinomycetota bacterium]|nr:phage major capsid protein [Actinomycetota bacterium]
MTDISSQMRSHEDASLRVRFAERKDAAEALGKELEAKGDKVSDADVQRLKEATAEVMQLADEVRRDEKSAATAFLYSLGGSGGGTSARFGSKAAWADEVAKRVTKTASEFGVKALSTGGIDIPSAVELAVPKPVEPVRVIDLLVSRKPLEGNEFEFLRQTVRTNNAAPVADNATKPTSVYTFEDEFDRARVFAHLTEAIPVRYLDDHEEIKNLLSTQLAEDLLKALESDILVGDGTGEHFTGVATVSGVQAQAFSTDVLTTLRKAHTKLTTSGETPTAWVLNHADLEAIDLTREDGATGGFMAGIDEKVFGGLPTVGSSVVPAGTAYLGDWNQSRLYVREAGRLDADVSGVLFEKNQVKLRYEGRFGFAVLRPNAFIEIDLTA